VAVAVLLLLTASPLLADSLCGPNSPFLNLYSDRKATTIGDVIHILVAESATAAQNMSDTTSSTSDSKVGPGLGVLSFLPEWGYGGQIAAQARGATTRSDTLTARLAVTVVGIAPNGNLLVQGERRMQVHKDFQTLTICGEVRPRDIGADSAVPSYKVANLKVTYTGSNPSRPGSKVGFITRALHWLF
jgi:flagellar L-ring protein precursor FlgH